MPIFLSFVAIFIFLNCQRQDIIDSLYYIWFGGSRIFDRKYIRYAKIDLLLSSVLPPLNNFIGTFKYIVSLIQTTSPLNSGFYFPVHFHSRTYELRQKYIQTLKITSHISKNKM